MILFPMVVLVLVVIDIEEGGMDKYELCM